MITQRVFETWFKKLADVYTENKEYLTELDSAIGDADHGINMARGFSAVKESLATPPSGVSSLFKQVSMTLIKTVGGASGPLYGTFFMKSAASLPQEPEISLEALAQALHVGFDGLKKMGKSVVGEKTMVDAWAPALVALDEAIKKKSADKNAIRAAADGAEAGMKATIPMLATKGRASYLGERSIGHQDPGATSTWLMLKTLAEVL